ncbi:MAG TPA: metalloregulator ArsR/SmtB family transcription factor [Gemmatimonadaceae bacterium]
MLSSTATTTRVFRALADPTRRAILERLATGEQSVTALVALFEISQPAITKHLNVLQASGLITRRQVGRRRIVRAKPLALRAPLTWMQRYASLWEGRLDQLEKLVADPELRRLLESK